MGRGSRWVMGSDSEGPDELQGDLQLEVGFTGAVLWHRPQSWATTGSGRTGQDRA